VTDDESESSEGNKYIISSTATSPSTHNVCTNVID